MGKTVHAHTHLEQVNGAAVNYSREITLANIVTVLQTQQHFKAPLDCYNSDILTDQSIIGL